MTAVQTASTSAIRSTSAKHFAIKRRALPEDVAVGQRVRGHRIELGMSQTSLADAIGITFQQVQKYEKGTNRISAGRLQKIAAALKMSPSALLGAKETSNETSLAEKMVATRQGCTFVTLWLKIASTKKRQTLIDTAALLT